MAEFAKVGDFCPNPDCPDYEQVQQSGGSNIIKFGHTRSGRQRYKCNTCNKTFTETIGTIFYRRRTDEREILECLAMVAEGSRLGSIFRIKGHKEDTVSDWIRDAAEHTEAVEDILMSEFRITRGQLDGLWSYVGNKGEKKRTS
jgi:transposase-like protein